MRCEFGYCIICDKEIAPACPHCGVRKPGPDYTEVNLKWSNDSIMKVAVCVDCAVKNAHEDPVIKDAITKAHFDHWDRESASYDKRIYIV